MFSVRLIAGLGLSALAGGLAGGWLDYHTLSDNDAVRALAVRLIAVIVVVVSCLVALRGSGSRSTSLAMMSIVFLVATFIGGWVAPSIHPAGWSAGTAHVELQGALSGSDAIGLECNSGVEGTRIGISATWPVGTSRIAADALGFGFSVQSESPLTGGSIPASASVSLFIDEGTPDSGRMFGNDPEATGVALVAEGTATQGRVSFRDLPSVIGKSPGAPAAGTTLSGSIAWTCDPPRDAPTQVDGSWFR